MVADGTPNITDQEVDAFIEHFGVKGMKWGVRRSRAELESHAQKHEDAAKAHASAAKQFKAKDEELQKKGVHSSTFKQVYGEDAPKQTNLQFAVRNGQNKGQALQETHNNLRMVHNQLVRSSNKHAAAAVKLHQKAAQATHSALDEDEFFEHFGVKGMKWGVRRSRSGSSGPVSEDAAKAHALRSQVKTSGTKSLNNAELQHLVTRMNLEQQFGRLTESNPSSVSKGQKFVKGAVSTGKLGLDAYKTGVEIKKLVDSAKK